MSNPLQKIWGLVTNTLPQEEFYKVLEVSYCIRSRYLDIAIFYKKIDQHPKIVEDYFILSPAGVIDIALSIHSIKFYSGKPVYSAYCKGHEEFLIYQIGKYYIYTKNEDFDEIFITPYPEQIISWAEEWKKELTPKEKIGLSLINTVIKKVKKSHD